MSRALVLGSGGQTGIGWEVGVLSALASRGTDVRSWDLVLGSSAGAFVGARLLAGHLEATLDELLEEDTAAARAAANVGMGNHLATLLAYRGPLRDAAVGAWTVGAVVRRFAGAARLGGLRSLRGAVPALRQYFGPSPLAPAELKALSNLCVGLRQRHVAAWEAYWSGRLMPEREWPEPRLGVVAFCTSTGRRRVFEADDGVPLATAVAASTAVPGLLGAVEIGGKHHVDAGSTDPTSTDLVQGFDEVLILAPTADPGELERSAAVLHRGGTLVEVIRPSDPAVLGDGGERLNVTRVRDAVQLGLRDGAAARIPARDA